MSLNGLDEPKVQEAHEAAVAEPGGWFLLKYASRDEVELLNRGNGGIVEVRNNVAEYEDTSPLYGFLRYRRRNVLIKYLPEDCSRLIQARVAVHFNAVCERFSPYDTTFEISTAKELKDTKLSAACSLHAASGSNSSSTSSLRRRRLMEIAEEEEDEQRATKRQSVLQEDDERLTTGDEPSSPTVPVTLNSELAASPEHANFAAPSTSEVPNFVGVDDRPMSPAESVDAARRNSSQSSRPDLFTYAGYPYGKPKVKLGPRPSLEAGGRPRTAGNFRPVSQIPAGFKLFGKGSKKGSGKEKDDAPNDEVNEMVIPEEPVHEIARPATSSGVSTMERIMPAHVVPTKPTMTPEKARLMKAMKLREKKKKMALKSSSGAPPPAVESPAPSEEEAPEEKDEDKTEGEDNATEDPNGDSAIALDASSSSMTTDQTSEASHPTSPIIASSEPDQSTKASSVSESTDETVHAKSEDLPENEDGEDTSDDETTDDEKPAEGAQFPEETTPTIAESKAEVYVEEIPVPDVDYHESDSDEESTTEEADTTIASEDEHVVISNDQHEEKIEEAVAVPIGDTPSSIPASPTSTAFKAETDQIPDISETPQAEDATVNKDEDSPLSSPSSPPLRIPKSKFSTQDLRSAAKNSPVPASSSPVGRSLREESPAIYTEEVALYEGGHNTQGSDAKPKRKIFIEPIRTDLDSRPVSRSDAHISDDESLMDELQSATFQEAKPMLVAKSPVTSVFPSPTKGGVSSHMVRTVSNPVRGTFLTPTDISQSSARSLSGGAAYLHMVTQNQAAGNLAAKNANIGSSISQRIKALEKLSASTAETNSHVVVTRDRPQSQFFSVRKGREPSRSPSVADRANSFTRQARTPPSRSGTLDESTTDFSRFPTRRERSNSVASRLSMFEPPTTDGHSPGAISRGRPESISVTAKIIRDPHQKIMKLEPPKDPSEYSHLELRQSPLMVDHQRAAPAPQWTPLASETKETIQERRMSKEGRRSESPSKDEKSRRSSLSVVKDFIKERRKSLTSPSSDVLAAPPSGSSRSPTRPPSTHQGSSFTQRLSISSRRSSFSRDRENVLSPSTTTDGSASGDDKSEKKKSSRAGRFMRRLSGLSSSRGKIASPTVISPTVTEEEPLEPKVVRPSTTPAPASTPSIVSYMGDVNVQFPDNLLWKRRNLCLDSQGFLILSALPAQSGRAAQGTKRYHLSEFRPPYVPDVEVQELPNSVVLDFIEGSGVQIACEDRAGQMSVLKILQEAHAGHATTFGL
ncbi:Fc.00g003570.m01.CDS01 [Cosmosporella sp. VM-42]